MTVPTFNPGDRIKVVRGIGATERMLLGREFTVVRIDRTHGYCVVGNGYGGKYYLHPEALERI